MLNKKEPNSQHCGIKVKIKQGLTMTTIRNSLLVCLVFNIFIMEASTPLGMFTPYDINLRLKKPALHHGQLTAFCEQSYHVQGYATDPKEEETFLVDVLQIYEPTQNVVSMYQGFDNTGAVVQTLTTPFTQLLDSIAGGPGGGVSDFQNGIFTPTGKLSGGQVALGATYALGNCFYISAYLPFCHAKLSNVEWKYSGDNILFASEKIQKELINSFAQDSKKYFGLNIGNWKQTGLGDFTVLVEWERNFPQMRPILRNVQANIRTGLSFPTSTKCNECVIMPVSFGADSSIGLPFGGGLSFSLGTIADVGFSGQFWYFWSSEKLRRIKTFPTQTSLLFPVVTNTQKQFSIVQNFNLFGQLYTSSKRFSAKGIYQHWRRQKDKIIPISTNFNFDVANSAESLDEITYHQIILAGIYSPCNGDFKGIIPQLELFWKGSFNGTRVAVASTVGLQFSLTF